MRWPMQKKLFSLYSSLAKGIEGKTRGASCIAPRVRVTTQLRPIKSRDLIKIRLEHGERWTNRHLEKT